MNKCHREMIQRGCSVALQSGGGTRAPDGSKPPSQLVSAFWPRGTHPVGLRVDLHSILILEGAALPLDETL
jgi:hypothetical protein